MAGEVSPASAGASAAALMMNPENPLAWINAGSQVLGAIKPSAAPTQAISSATQYATAAFDNSGWTVATGNGKATATPPLGLPWNYILIAAVVGLLIWKRA